MDDESVSQVAKQTGLPEELGTRTNTLLHHSSDGACHVFSRPSRQSPDRGADITTHTVNVL